MTLRMRISQPFSLKLCIDPPAFNLLACPFKVRPRAVLVNGASCLVVVTGTSQLRRVACQQAMSFVGVAISFVAFPDEAECAGMAVAVF